MTTPSQCPGIDCWQLLLDSTSSPQQRGQLERHLESCSVCQERIDQAEESRGALRTLGRQFGDPTLAPVDPTLEQVRERLQATKPLSGARPAVADELSFLRAGDQPGRLGTLGVYEVHEVIGTGGMGVVLRAFDPRLQRQVAIKVLSPSLAGSITARQRFLREGHAAATIRHEHVLTIHDVAEVDGLPYLVMPFIEGKSLQDRLDRQGALPVLEVVQIGLQAASGLAAAHARGIVHRDIKPANLLLENSDEGEGIPITPHVRITDFGLARAADDVQLTQSGVVVGTPQYMSPEQARGETVDQRSDLFSLGSVLYTLCTGLPPFQGATLDVLRKLSEETPVPVRKRNAAIPAWLEAFILRLLAKDPADRFQSAAEVATLLEGFLVHILQPATPAPELPPQPVNRSLKGSVWGLRTRITRWPLQRLGIAVLVLLAALGLARSFVLAVLPEQGSTTEFYHDFRGRPLPDGLTLFGDQQFLHSEREGLRITLPKNRNDLEGVGIYTAFETGGDFEITTTFEILQAEIPPPSFGVGVILVVKKAQPSRGAASISRLARVKDRQVLVWDRSVEQPDPNGSPKMESGSSLCTDKVGRLRLQRTKTTLHYLWAPGTSGDDFQEIHQCEFGSEDIGRVIVSGVTGRKPCELDLRLIDLRIRGTPTGAQSAAAPPRGWRVWLALALMSTLVLGVWLAVQRSRRVGRVPTNPPSPHPNRPGT
jgi:serine/threonine protein kinase